jgi:hypothetical protein
MYAGKKYGNPHLSVRIPRDSWHLIRAVCRQRDQTPSELVREIVAEWTRNVRTTPQTDPQLTQAIQSIPLAKKTREDSNKAEPIAYLQAIDAKRSGSKSGFVDL